MLHVLDMLDKCLLNPGPFPPRKQDTGIETPFSLVDFCSPEAAATINLMPKESQLLSNPKKSQRPSIDSEKSLHLKRDIKDVTPELVRGSDQW